VQDTTRLVLHENTKVDVVSMQFCMHYAFKTEAMVRQMLRNVVRHLNVNGVFIGTCPNAKVLKNRLQSLPPGEKSFGNSMYTVTFAEPYDAEDTSTYGVEYSFHLVDAVDDCPEYLVNWKEFSRYGLH
jgi:mRNA (guanine-N7-)-methyltransferase